MPAVGFGLGPAFTRNSLGGASIPVVEFGALTLATHGGYAIPGDATSIFPGHGTNLVVASGELVPDTGGGVTSGTVMFDDGTVWSISAIANSYSVADVTELEAVLELAALAIGDQVLLRSGTYNDARTDVIAARTALLTNHASWASTADNVVVKPHTGAAPTITRFTVSNTGIAGGADYITFAPGITWRVDVKSGGENFCATIVGGNYCRIVGNTFAGTITVTSFIETQMQSAIIVSGNNIEITQNTIQDTYKGVSISGQDCSFTLNTIRRVMQDVCIVTAGASRSGLQIIGNTITDMPGWRQIADIVGITTGASTTITVSGTTWYDETLTDEEFRIDGITTGPTILNGNAYKYDGAAVANGSDWDIVLKDGDNNPIDTTGQPAWSAGGSVVQTRSHTDAIAQFRQIGQVAGQWDGITIRNNRAWRGSGPDVVALFSFADFQGVHSKADAATGDGAIDDFVCENNLIVNGFLRGIAGEFTNNCIFKNNTAIHSPDNDSDVGTAIGSDTLGPTVYAYGCVANGISSAIIQTDCVEIDISGLTQAQQVALYETYFTDPDVVAIEGQSYDPSDRWTALASGPLDQTPVLGWNPAYGLGLTYSDPWLDVPVLLSSTTPADNATDVDARDNIFATFDQPVQLQTSAGTLRLYKADDTLIETFTPSSTSAATGSLGSTLTRIGDSHETLRIQLVAAVDVSTGFYILIDDDFLEAPSGAAYAGISDKTAWSWTTAATVLWKPTDMAGVELWIDPSDQYSRTIVDGLVTALADKIGTDDFEQATSGREPTLTTLNGLGALSGDDGKFIHGSETTNKYFADNTNSFTLATVYRRDSASSTHDPILGWGNGNLQHRSDGTTFRNNVRGANTDKPAAVANNTTHTVVFSWDHTAGASGLGTLRIDGVTVDAAIPAGAAVDAAIGLTMMASTQLTAGNSTLHGIQCELVAALVASSFSGTTDGMKLEGYLRRYGSTFGGGHTYASSPPTL